MKKKISLSKILILAILVYSIASVVNQQIKINQIKKNIVVQKEELKSVKETNQKLQDEVQLSKTSESYFEKLARERLGYIKNGETPVIDTKSQK